MQTFEVGAIGVVQLDNVVLETPVLALQRHMVVELFEQLRDGRVTVEADMPQEAEFWEAMAAHDKPEAHILVSHVGGMRWGVHVMKYI